MAQSNGYDGNVIPLIFNNEGAQIEYKTANMNLKELSKHPLPLGLRLTVTPEMLQFREQKMNGVTETTTPCIPEVKKVEKLKAVHFSINMLMIGFYKVEAKSPIDLVAKFYYAKRKLVWEMLRDGLKDKIEIQWQNISAIRAVVQKNLPGILEIELDRVPFFFREIEPKPGKHTMWTISQDFTHGQASQYRRHYLQFAPGVLDQHYEKLLQCDNRLLELSQRPFPSSLSACFDSHLDQGTTYFSFDHDLHVHGSKTTSTSEQQPILFSPQKAKMLGPLSLFANNDPTSPTSDEAISNQIILQDPLLTFWSQGLHYDTLISMNSIQCASSIQRNEPMLNYEPPSHINNMLLRGYHIQEFDSAESVSSNADQSMEEGLVNTYQYKATSTQVDWHNGNIYTH